MRWYALMWLAGFGLVYLNSRVHAKAILGRKDAKEIVDDMMIYGGFGALLGGRLGYILFYGLELYRDDLLGVFKIWQGGMSFHGGLVGVAAGLIIVSRQHRLAVLRIADLASLGVPLGLLSGRLGNFINGELWGKVSDLPWAVTFPAAGAGTRHPSQLYEMLVEGALLYLLLLRAARARVPVGVLTGLFLLVYSVARFALEFLREPDAHLGYLALGLSMGQWLSLPCAAAGLLLLVAAWRKGEPLAVQTSGKKAAGKRRSKKAKRKG